MRFIPLLVLLVITLSSVAQTKHALVCAIGDYPVYETDPCSGWSKINGDNDIPFVLDILYANGFQQPNIAVLKNEEATFNGIKMAFKRLLKAVACGDVVYIHFSGHGQLITDLDGDEESGLDESMIPYDARRIYRQGVYEGENHLVDDTLNVWLNELYEKITSTGKIVFIADACHSGGGSRGDEDDEYTIRGTSDVFDIPFFEIKVNKKTPRSEQWVYISACETKQINREYRQQQCGSLTYALYLERANISSLSAITLVSKINQHIKALLNNWPQTSVLDAPEELKYKILL